MIQIKRNLIFSPERRKRDGDLVTSNIPIRLRVNYDGKRVEVSTDYNIDLENWNKDKAQAKGGCSNKKGKTTS